MTLREIDQIDYQNDERKNMTWIQNKQKEYENSPVDTSLIHMSIRSGGRYSASNLQDSIIIITILSESGLCLVVELISWCGLPGG